MDADFRYRFSCFSARPTTTTSSAQTRRHPTARTPSPFRTGQRLLLLLPVLDRCSTSTSVPLPALDGITRRWRRHMVLRSTRARGTLTSRRNSLSWRTFFDRSGMDSCGQRDMQRRGLLGTATTNDSAHAHVLSRKKKMTKKRCTQRLSRAQST
jgi:hypothetical protein